MDTMLDKGTLGTRPHEDLCVPHARKVS